jgi:hypothetical protein
MANALSAEADWRAPEAVIQPPHENPRIAKATAPQSAPVNPGFSQRGVIMEISDLGKWHKSISVHLKII